MLYSIYIIWICNIHVYYHISYNSITWNRTPICSKPTHTMKHWQKVRTKFRCFNLILLLNKFPCINFLMVINAKIKGEVEKQCYFPPGIKGISMEYKVINPFPLKIANSHWFPDYKWRYVTSFFVVFRLMRHLNMFLFMINTYLAIHFPQL